MHRLPLLAVLLCLAACDGEEDDTAPSDTDADTDTDTDAVPWDWCPNAAAYVGDDGWTGSIEASADARYCGASSESRTLEDELRLKAMLRVIEGDWPMPAEQGGWPFSLPLCVRRPDPADRPLLAEDGLVVASTMDHGGLTYLTVSSLQPMETDAGTPWTLGSMYATTGPIGGPPDPVVLDGTTGGTGVLGTSSWTLWASDEDTPPYDTDTILFTPCADPAWRDNVHSIGFDGGEVTLTLQIGQSMASTEPSAFVRAQGTLDGTPFTQTSYWKLVYRPEHHHFVRHFAVVFDAPIGDACALRVEEVDPWSKEPSATVHTADCALAALEARAVTSETLVQEQAAGASAQRTHLRHASGHQECERIGGEGHRER
jgi:hypothetical protein